MSFFKKKKIGEGFCFFLGRGYYLPKPKAIGGILPTAVLMEHHGNSKGTGSRKMGTSRSDSNTVRSPNVSDPKSRKFHLFYSPYPRTCNSREGGIWQRFQEKQSPLMWTSPYHPAGKQLIKTPHHRYTSVSHPRVCGEFLFTFRLAPIMLLLAFRLELIRRSHHTIPTRLYYSSSSGNNSRYYSIRTIRSICCDLHGHKINFTNSKNLVSWLMDVATDRVRRTL